MIKNDIIFSQSEIEHRIQSLAQEIIDAGYTQFVMISILKGSFMFAADLSRALSQRGAQVHLDFIKTSSYMGREISNKQVNIVDLLECDIKGKQVLLVDDILDSGNTLHFVMQYLNKKGAADIKICVLLEKIIQRQHVIQSNFIGFRCPNRFVFGYGMDYKFGARCLPYVAAKDCEQ